MKVDRNLPGVDSFTKCPVAIFAVSVPGEVITEFGQPPISFVAVRIGCGGLSQQDYPLFQTPQIVACTIKLIGLGDV
jgi:hypothetical protein